VRDQKARRKRLVWRKCIIHEELVLVEDPIRPGRVVCDDCQSFIAGASPRGES